MIKAELQKIKKDKFFLSSLIIYYFFSTIKAKGIVYLIARSYYGQPEMSYIAAKYFGGMWNFLGLIQLITIIFGIKVLHETTESRLYTYIFMKNSRLKFYSKKAISLLWITTIYSIYNLIIFSYYYITIIGKPEIKDLIMTIVIYINYEIAILFTAILGMMIYTIVKNNLFSIMVSLFVIYTYFLLPRYNKIYHPLNYVYLMTKKLISSKGIEFVIYVGLWRIIIPMAITMLIFTIGYRFFRKYEPKY
ncbi:hypothetical protein XO10_10250 [Marinitoga sp. 1135]|uniref:ABC-2 family transporter protein n=2 Tax=Marinitoga TaxID=160798 RepID=H2J7H3_MARPK|nr:MULTISPECIES: ABC transporter permease [Marinitoga]AEX86466.1 hypothetical protein Marpi_2091 [Marinitoga piezophila KA3]APT76851.1 hypothetical protein LN42_11030 [Marinitoga sp. 1137]NUU96606.1 hypothetical protein [Marinitoga sp. 1135]